MDPRADGRLQRLLRHGVFCVTAEIVPPRSADPEIVARQARSLVGSVDAANITDNPTASAHMSAVAGAALASAAGVEPVLQVTCRDRNRLAITSDLLGAWALGARNLLCLTGDSPAHGDHPDAAGVFDLTTEDLIQLATGLRDHRRLLSGAEIAEAPRYFVGVADVPLSDRYEWAKLERKIDAGADFVQTQIVFDVDAFGAWADGARDRGILERVFVLAGVAVAGSPGAARYLGEQVPGVVVPDAVTSWLEEAGPEAGDEGIRIAVELVAKIKGIAGIHGVHLMGLGRTDPLRRVVEGAGLFPRPLAA